MNFHAKIKELLQNIETVFVGKSEVVRMSLVGLFSNGHLLIEDVPGVGKSTLAKAMARSIDCSFKRIQFTPDLLPSDILGVSVYNSKINEFVFNKGPIFANVILADEINRTTPRTQSSLLEAMNDFQVSVDRNTYSLEKPFIIIATQNPFEFEGTYPLPESQLDRFLLKINVGYPDRSHEREVVKSQKLTHPVESLKSVINKDEVLAIQEEVQKVTMEDSILEYILDIVEFTRNSDKVDVGVSPRGSVSFSQACKAMAYVSGRDFVSPDDVKKLAVPCLAHRIISRAVMHGLSGDSNANIIEEALNMVSVPI